MLAHLLKMKIHKYNLHKYPHTHTHTSQYMLESPLAEMTAVSLTRLGLEELYTPGLCHISPLLFLKFFKLCQIGC